MDGDFNFLNNVVYNWRHRTVDGGDQKSTYCIVNNYFKPGPTTPEGAIRYRVLRPDGRRPGPDKTLAREWGKAYVAGNVVEGNDAVTKDNWAGGVQTDGPEDSKKVLAKVKLDKIPSMPKHELQTAAAAYADVLDHAGATLPIRDAVDKRTIESVRKGTALPGTKNGIITDIKQVGGYPDYKGPPGKDRDGDGIPDWWEAKYKLNPNDPSDATIAPSADGYTNIEMYINGIDPTKKVDYRDLRNNRDTLMRSR
jgi:hypothetical protein